MNDRLTAEWTKNSEQAFGINGAKGDAGEKYLAKVFKKWKWGCEFYSDKKHQLLGVDCAFKNPKWRFWYTADVKNNLSSSGVFYVDTSPRGWLFTSWKTSDRIWHVNPSTGWMAWYNREEMRDYLKRSNKVDVGLVGFDVRYHPSFVTTAKVPVA